MNIQQFHYILAVAEFKHFETAAEACCITQSTLSTMINRFEDEIGIKVFCRKTKPVSITKEGVQIIQRLRIIQQEIDSLKNITQELRGEMTGELRIGIIPTVAPYLLSLFLSKFAKAFSKVKIIVKEITTAEIQKHLKNRTLDVGILATPLEDVDLVELDLYSEPFLLYDCYSEKRKTSVSIEELDYSKLWLLEEEHCLCTQVQNICKLSNKSEDKNTNIEFKASSLDSLVRFTRESKGITVLPYLASSELSKEEKHKLIPFDCPIPVRSIGLITHKHFVKKKLLHQLQETIQKSTQHLIPLSSKIKKINPL